MSLFLFSVVSDVYCGLGTSQGGRTSGLALSQFKKHTWHRRADQFSNCLTFRLGKPESNNFIQTIRLDSYASQK